MPESPAAAMFARDQASQQLGMTLVESTPGYALVRMAVRDDMIQGHGTCHGGFVFALADSALAFACNGYGYTAVAANCSIDFLAPVRLGDLLTATAREQVRAGRTGIYDVAVSNQQGTVVALFRGRSRQVSDAK